MQFVETAPWFIFFTFLSGAICWLAPAAVISWGLGHLYFAPLNEPNVLFAIDNRFRISDLIVLAVHLQVVIALAVGLTGRESIEFSIAMIAILGLLIVFWWFNGVRMLARAGVTYTWHRWIFLGVIMPLAYLSTLQLVASFLTIPLSLGLLIQMVADANFLGMSVAILAIVCSILSMVMIQGSRAYCRTMVERARADRAEHDGIGFEVPDPSGVTFLPDEHSQES